MQELHIKKSAHRISCINYNLNYYLKSIYIYIYMLKNYNKGGIYHG